MQEKGVKEKKRNRW